MTAKGEARKRHNERVREERRLLNERIAERRAANLARKKASDEKWRRR